MSHSLYIVSFSFLFACTPIQSLSSLCDFYFAPIPTAPCHIQPPHWAELPTLGLASDLCGYKRGRALSRVPLACSLSPSCAALLLRCLVFRKDNSNPQRRWHGECRDQQRSWAWPDINPGSRWGLPLDFLVTQSSKCCFVWNQTDLIHFTPAHKASPVTQAMTSLYPPFVECPFVTDRCHSLGTSAVRYWRFILFSRTSPVFPILGVACSFALVSTCLKKQPALGLVDWHWPKDLYQSGGRVLGLCSSLPACPVFSLALAAVRLGGEVETGPWGPPTGGWSLNGCVCLSSICSVTCRMTQATKEAWPLWSFKWFLIVQFYMLVILSHGSEHTQPRPLFKGGKHAELWILNTS